MVQDGEIKNDQDNSVIWLLDSGCSHHMTGKKSLFTQLAESLSHVVKLGDDNDMKVNGKGAVTITLQSGALKLIHDVYYVPQLAHNLLSIGQLDDN